MPFPESFLKLTHRPEFWSQFFFDGGNQEFPNLENCRLEFPVGPQYALVLNLDEFLGYFGLNLKHPNTSEPVEIAWDDQAHWHPHVLRWEELDLVCRCIALDDPTLPHPGLPLALLHRFAPVTLDDNDDVVHPLITEAYRTLEVFSEPQITEMIYRYDRRQSGFGWYYTDPQGWLPETREGDGRSGFYSLREPQNTEFPFDGLNALFTAARQRLVAVVDPSWLVGSAGELARIVTTGDVSAFPVLADALQEAGCDVSTFLDGLRAVAMPVRGCWVVETLLGRQTGDVIAKALGHTRRPPRVVYRFEFSFPVLDERTVQPDRVDRVLDAALRAAGIGKASSVGSSARGNPPQAYEIRIRATVNDDGVRGLAIIREVLTRANAPRSTIISLAWPEAARYPLVPGDPV